MGSTIRAPFQQMPMAKLAAAFQVCAEACTCMCEGLTGLPAMVL